MNRTERLLKLLQILRSYRYPVTGQRLAERLDISLRTLYRDIATLQAQGADISGEAGIGYKLNASFFLPPLMFTHDEIQALLLGTRWVCQYGDKPLAEGANEALTKILSVLPNTVTKDISRATLRVGPPSSKQMAEEDLSQLRQAIAKQNKVSIEYKINKRKQPNHTIWPFSIGYFIDQRILIAWSETIEDYLHIKTIDIMSVEILQTRYQYPKENLFYEWRKIQLKKYDKE